MLSSVFNAALLLCASSAGAFRGLPSLPGYLHTFETDGSLQDQINIRFYGPRRQELKGKNYSKNVGVLENIVQAKDKDPVLNRIRQNVETDIQKISDEVGLVSKQISAIYNNKKISNEERNNAIMLLTERHPKIVPAVLNLIGYLHKINISSVSYNRS